MQAPKPQPSNRLASLLPITLAAATYFSLIAGLAYATSDRSFVLMGAAWGSLFVCIAFAVGVQAFLYVKR